MTKTAKLTERQEGMLEGFRRLPKRFRHQDDARAPLRIEVLDMYDARIWSGLFDKGFLQFSTAIMGFRVLQKDGTWR
jgi:hypothetical protein